MMSPLYNMLMTSAQADKAKADADATTKAKLVGDMTGETQPTSPKESESFIENELASETKLIT